MSGLAGDLDRLVRSKQPRARFAVELLLYRISREVGSLAAAPSGLDAIVFTTGTGPHAAAIRAGILAAEPRGWAWISTRRRTRRAGHASRGRGAASRPG